MIRSKDNFFYSGRISRSGIYDHETNGHNNQKSKSKLEEVFIKISHTKRIANPILFHNHGWVWVFELGYNNVYKFNYSQGYKSEDYRKINMLNISRTKK